MEARLPADKLTRLSTDLNPWQTKTSATLQELQSLFGTLNFVCKLLQMGEVYFSTLSGKILQHFLVSIPMLPVPLVSGGFLRISGSRVHGCPTKLLTQKT